MTCFIVVRHGETHWNLESRIQGHSDSALTASGLAQAAAIAARLAGESFERLVSSDLARARLTAEAIAARTGHTIEFDSRLRERNFGEGEGLTYGELDHQYPEVFSKVRTTDPDYVIPGGESRRQHYDRVVAAFESLTRESPGARIAVVCHGGVLAALYRRIHGIAVSVPHPIPIPNASYNRVVAEAGAWRIEAWGDTAHLEAVAALVDS